MKAIYETKGRAREYNELAVNLYTGCGHQCVYCYGADVTHQTKDAFNNQPKPRKGVLEQMGRDARYYQSIGEKRQVLMCFVTDPYQPIEEELEITRQAIKILHLHGLKVIVLTKAGYLAQRDFDLLGEGDSFATTLTLTTDHETKKWEINAGLPLERIDNLRVAHEQGINTWVSCEPVIETAQTLEMIERSADYVDLFKVGTMNYHEQGKNVDWHKFAVEVKALLERLGKPYYLKKDLVKYL